MIAEIMFYLGGVGKIVTFSLIIWVIVTAVVKHGKPKVIEHNMYHSIGFTTGLIFIYAINGMLNIFTIGVVCVALIHIVDIGIALRKHKFVEFTVFNAYKSVPLMIFYFMTLYLANFWNPLLIFSK